MLRTIRFHPDENSPNAIAEGLRRRGIDVTTTPEAGLISATDEEQTVHARAEGRVIFTQDQDFLAINRSWDAPRRHRLWPPGQATLGQIIVGLTQIWETMEPDEMKERSGARSRDRRP